MDSLSLPEATQNLDNLINQITKTHTPVMIKGTQNEVIIVSKEDWSAIQETIYLNSIPGYIDRGMRSAQAPSLRARSNADSIQEIINSPREEWTDAKDLGL